MPSSVEQSPVTIYLPGQGRWFWWRLIALLALVIVSGQELRAAPSEIEIKAAFILNFCRFTEWPDEQVPAPEEQLHIAVAGASNSEFGSINQLLQNKEVYGRQITVSRYEEASSPPPQVLYIRMDDQEEAHRILETIDTTNTLVISEISGFARNHSTINFVQIGRNIRFEINLDRIQAAHFTLSSKLLNLCIPVHTQTDNQGLLDTHAAAMFLAGWMR